MTTRRTVLYVAAVGLAVLLAGGPRAAVATEHEDIAAMVANAKTPADHEAIAAYYDKQAAAARAEAEKHRKMADTYRGGSPLVRKGAGGVPLPQHCINLAKDYDEAVKLSSTCPHLKYRGRIELRRVDLVD